MLGISFSLRLRAWEPFCCVKSFDSKHKFRVGSKFFNFSRDFRSSPFHTGYQWNWTGVQNSSSKRSTDQAFGWKFRQRRKRRIQIIRCRLEGCTSNRGAAFQSCLNFRQYAIQMGIPSWEGSFFGSNEELLVYLQIPIMPRHESWYEL